MDSPAPLSFSQAAVLVVAAHAAGVTHGAAYERQHAPAPAEPVEQPEPTERPDPLIIGHLYWSVNGNGLMFLDSQTPPGEGDSLLLCSIWRVIEEDGTERHHPGWEAPATLLRMTGPEESEA